MFVLRRMDAGSIQSAYACQDTNRKPWTRLSFPPRAEVMTTFGSCSAGPSLNLPVDVAGLNDWIERQKSGNPLDSR